MVAETYAGPIVYVVAAFPAGASADAGFDALLRKADEGVISILDLEVVGRGEDGAGHRLDVNALPVAGRALKAAFDGAESRVLDDTDIATIAQALPDGWVAVALVYEERSLAQVVAAWDSAGAELLLTGGVEPDDLEAALQGTQTTVEEG